MIELKDVTTKPDAVYGGQLEQYSLIVKDGELCRLGKQEGTLVIRTLVGFLEVDEGYVSFDGMLLNEHSVAFLRKMVAYIPGPEGFYYEDDPSVLQKQMVSSALGSDADVILAIDPVSHQTDESAREIMEALQRKAAKGRVVVVATDRTDVIPLDK